MRIAVYNSTGEYIMPIKNYLSQNSKIKKMSGVKTFNWGIPAFRSKDNFITCPKAGICAKGCYAKQGTYIWSNVSQAFENRLQLSQSDQFIYTINAEIKRRKVERLRIHDSGDFYNQEYLDNWLRIVVRNPTVKFYAYTKMISLIKNKHYTKILEYIPNITFIYSYGGKEDHLIDSSTDRHSQVFDNLKELLAAGYIDASKDDSNAISTNPKVGLIYHGAKGKKWITK
jgi:hypothetical protein